MFLAAELIPILLSPLVLLGALIAFSLLFKKRLVGLFALVALWALSLNVVSQSITQALEADYPLVSLQAAPKASAVVVLGGMSSLAQVRSNTNADSGVDAQPVYERQWEEGADRFWAGVELFKAGKAPQLIFTGGRMPWSPVKETEGDWLALQAKRIGVPADRILVSGQARNTAQEAKAVAALLKTRNILLVTSAFHMPRAKKIFEDAGFQVNPVAVDSRLSAGPTRWSDFLPSAQALRKSSEAIREWIGRAYYRV
jgi:uncharacterized SAM-binding protein YcdF (DUF218 family)